MTTEFEKSSGNVYADLGYAHAEAHKTKARLVERIGARIEARSLTQVAAAKVLGMTQPDVSKMLRGQFRSMTIDRLVQCLLALGEDVNIMVASPKTSSRRVEKRGRLRVVAA